MADVVSSIRTYLLGRSAVTDVLSQRIYLDVLKQSATLPAATISKVSETHSHLISDRSGFVQTRLQIECFALQRLVANSLAEAIYKSGVAAIKGVTNGVNIRGVTVDDGQRNYIVQDADGGDDHTYVTQFDLMVSYLES